MSDPSVVALFVMRAHFAMNVLGAGNSGVQLLRGDSRGVIGFWGAPVTPPLAAATVGSMWAATALVSLAGLAAPVTFR
jgi:hypothetical protein